MTDIGRLRELEAKATKGIMTADDPYAINTTYIGNRWFATFLSRSDAAYHIELRNAAPHLLSEIETLRAENERLRNEREPLQRQANETFCKFLDRGNELVSLRAQLAAAERVVTVARTMDAELDDVNNTVLFIVSDQEPHFARAYKRAVAAASRLRDSITAYDQGKVTNG